ncbi:MAG: hypothetical protein BIFFINMI_00419 [Phycisphaerae bacterium]|nr:hypothetical protein [Phycisphaerae bacterium]
MSLPHPFILAAALAVAAVAIRLLLRPPRRRVEVAHVELWREAARQSAGRRATPLLRIHLLLIATGGLLVAAAAGGAVLNVRQPAAGPVLVLIARTPQLDARAADGTGQADALHRRLAELRGVLGTTPGLLVGVAGQGGEPATFALADTPADPAASLQTVEPPDAAALIAAWRRPDTQAVYLLGEFRNVPSARADVHWLFRPLPPATDVGIVAAGAQAVDAHVQLFASLRRLAGVSPRATVAALDAAGRELARGSVDFDSAGRAGLVLLLPGELAGPITLRLADPDDQPANDAFYLAPAQASARATFRLTGRPNAGIARAVATIDNMDLADPAAGQPADWLIVNEPADPVAPAPGQWQVVIDPLVAPEGVRFAGELRPATVATIAASSPLSALPLDGVTAARATAVELGEGWESLASDAAGHPLIAWRPDRGLVVVFFSVASANTNWADTPAWPLFWHALPSLHAGSAGGRWTWRAGLPGGLRDGIAYNPPELACVAASAAAAARVNTTAIEPPAESPGISRRAVWSWLALAGAALLAAGWLTGRAGVGLTVRRGGA